MGNSTLTNFIYIVIGLLPVPFISQRYIFRYIAFAESMVGLAGILVMLMQPLECRPTYRNCLGYMSASVEIKDYVLLLLLLLPASAYIWKIGILKTGRRKNSNGMRKN